MGLKTKVGAGAVVLALAGYWVALLILGPKVEVLEAVRQVRGDSTCQVPDVELSLSVSGPGFAPGSPVLFGALR